MVLDALDDEVARIPELLHLVNYAMIQLNLLLRVKLLQQTKHNCVRVPITRLGWRGRQAAHWLLRRGQEEAIGAALDDVHLEVICSISRLFVRFRGATLPLNVYGNVLLLLLFLTVISL